MSITTIIKDCLFEYVQIILKFEQELIDTYNLEDNPYQCQRLFPRTGIIAVKTEVFEYRFHGSGCSFNFSGIEVYYDYKISDLDYITIVSWKFWRFVVTSLLKKKRDELTIEQVADTLEQLNTERIIKKNHPSYLNYQISFSWFEKYMPLEKCD